MKYDIVRKLVLSILSGVLLGISWHSFGFPLYIFVSFVPLLFLEQELVVSKEKKTIIKIFFFSYLSFLIWNLIVIHWLGYSKRSDGSYAIEALVLPLLINSFLMSGVFTLYHWTKKTIGGYLGGPLFFICVWIAFEKLHLDWALTFPWLNLGNVFAKYHRWVQWYEYTGTFGGSLWILLINVFIFHHYRSYLVSQKSIYLKKLFFFLPLFIGIPILCSYFRYFTFKEQGDKIESIILQPNLDPYTEKYTLSGEQLLTNLLELSDKKINKTTDFIIAPETAFPGQKGIYLNFIEKNVYIKLIKNYLNSKNSSCIFVSGVSTYKTYTKEQPKRESVFWNPYSNSYEEHFNSAIQITSYDSDSNLIYHKSKLVMGVERMPFTKKINKLLQNLLSGFNGDLFSLGTQENRLIFRNRFNLAVVAPIICYESIYGEYVGEYIKKGANILFIMTNDSWWENSEGHKQLLMLAKLRAIETRKNIIRSANSGISCVIDSKGDIHHSLNYLEYGAIRVESSINNDQTVYVLYGDYIVKICLLFLGVTFTCTILQLFSLLIRNSLLR